jgi:uncharacterized protein (DUF1810 family)
VLAAHDDPFSLRRFELAQEAGESYRHAVSELRAGRKRTHWIWYVFPQLAGLGRSATAQRYAISGLQEAQAYLLHPLLGTRLRECASILDQLDGPSADEILGSVDAQKLRSSMTLFARAAPQERIFDQVLEHYFGGERDPLTERLLAERGG